MLRASVCVKTRVLYSTVRGAKLVSLRSVTFVSRSKKATVVRSFSVTVTVEVGLSGKSGEAMSAETEQMGL